jgi:hypothetical protein
MTPPHGFWIVLTPALANVTAPLVRTRPRGVLAEIIKLAARG